MGPGNLRETREQSQATGQAFIRPEERPSLGQEILNQGRRETGVRRSVGRSCACKRSVRALLLLVAEASRFAQLRRGISGQRKREEAKRGCFAYVMLIILAGEQDEVARDLVRRWSSFDAHLVTPKDLSQPGWCHRPGSRAQISETRGLSVLRRTAEGRDTWGILWTRRRNRRRTRHLDWTHRRRIDSSALRVRMGTGAYRAR